MELKTGAKLGPYEIVSTIGRGGMGEVWKREGITLAERIKQGPLPLDEAMGIARQIADALEAAHEKGIIHRDLKPANVRIRPDDSIKASRNLRARCRPRGSDAQSRSGIHRHA